MNIADIRREYRRQALDESQVDPEPLHQFSRWFDEAVAADVPEPNAMTLCLADPTGRPTGRIVLLKGIDSDGLLFFTNYQSQKAQTLAANPQASVVFFWPELERQVRVEGQVQQTEASESDDYFESRPRESQIGALGLPAKQRHPKPRPSRTSLRRSRSAIRKPSNPPAPPLGRLPPPPRRHGILARPARPIARPHPLSQRSGRPMAHRTPGPLIIPMHKTLVINAVGLTPELIGPFTPRLRAFRDAGKLATIGSVLPAVTTTVQSTYLTGAHPAGHGIVANGWYFRDECEIKFWRQSNHLVEKPKLWDMARQHDPSFTCANICWWYAMYSSADYTVTPRPMYPADGRKLPDIWAHPPDLRQSLQKDLGQFPLFKFWGPATSIDATQWIAGAAIRVDERYHPTLTLVYLPHLDYCLQRRGPDPAKSETDLRQLDAVCGQLIDHFATPDATPDTRIIILSEYGITSVSQPVHLNRVLRERGLITVRDEMGREVLDPGESKAFAVADHQIAHIHVNDPAVLDQVRDLLTKTPGVERVLDEAGKREWHLDHARSGELVAIASPDAWFTYYYWLDDARAPDFARTVDIHRKPGYDPAELFIDPALPLAKAKIAWTLLRKKLGFRAMLEVIPLDASLVRGSHGRPAPSPAQGPLFITNQNHLLDTPHLPPTDVCAMLLKHLTAPP